MTTDRAASRTEVVAFGSAAGAGPEPAALSVEGLGAKAVHLIRMAAAGLPVPSGFVLSTEVCRRYHRDGRAALDPVMAEVQGHLGALEAKLDRGFGAARRPLLLSVRSGAAQSMPGMLETVLNVGLTRTAISGLLRATGNPRFVWDCYRRLVQQYAEVVEGLSVEPFADLADAELAEAGVDTLADLDFAHLESLAEAFLLRFRSLTGHDFPEDPQQQLHAAIEAVLRSWMSDKARTYRRLSGLSDAGGTAVTVQAMVFGNAGQTSGSGVAFTRDPDTGEKRLYADFCFGGQGEDVVSGRFAVIGAQRLAGRLPAVWTELQRIATRLEGEFRDMQDFEFTVENGRLWLLQSRPGWRSPRAAVRIAVDLVAEGLIDEQTALDRLVGMDARALEQRRLTVGADDRPLAHATPASFGCAVGALAFDVEAARKLVAAGRPVILARHDLSTADIEGLRLADGVVTAAGARTSHAAVVARALGKACLVGCRDLRIAKDAACCRFGSVVVSAGEFISLDASTGTIYRGRMPVTKEATLPELATIEEWRSRARGSTSVGASS
ncbi:MAG: pyruvate, phosphate dikinase [Rhodospirillales bacterium]